MTSFAGLKALIVEDDGSIAWLLEDMLQELGCEIAASVGGLAEAVELARVRAIDFAVLDLNLNGQPALPVAGILRKRGIPLVFSTGYGAVGLPDEFRSCPVLAKPYRIESLRSAIMAALGGSDSSIAE
jgi:CheY-like chemotaxis protein